VDAYRLGGPEEIDDIDLDMTQPDSVTVVEWGEGIAEGLADDRLEIRIERHHDDTRTVHLRAVGARWNDIDLPGSRPGLG
jgi:tRNA threonylcarbamoyladenosine biosynthesis protein TsaE